MKQFITIPNGLIDEQTAPHGSGIFFLHINDPNRDRILKHLEVEVGICAFLDQEGKTLSEEYNTFKKFLSKRPPSAGFLLFIRKFPFIKEVTNHFLTKTEESGVYEILSSSNPRCPKISYSFLLQVKKHPLLDD